MFLVLICGGVKIRFAFRPRSQTFSPKMEIGCLENGANYLPSGWPATANDQMSGLGLLAQMIKRVAGTTFDKDTQSVHRTSSSKPRRGGLDQEQACVKLDTSGSD